MANPGQYDDEYTRSSLQRKGSIASLASASPRQNKIPTDFSRGHRSSSSVTSLTGGSMSMKRSDSLSDRIQNSSWLERDRATVATNQRPPSSSTSTTTSRPSSPVPSYTSYSLKIPSSPKRGLSVSSSLFSTRLDPISTSASIPFPSSRSPLSATDINGDDQRVGLTRAQSNLASLQGHKRSMTLPHLTTTLPGTDRYLENVVVPKKEEVVVGLPGRARLLSTRPTSYSAASPSSAAASYSSNIPSSSPSLVSPSLVFSSSRGKSPILPSSSELTRSPTLVVDGLQRTTSLANKRASMPVSSSQSVKAMEMQRQNLLAYDYLCHGAEARQWMDSQITTIATPLPLPRTKSGGVMSFEQSLRDGYALAHLARSLGGYRGFIYTNPERVLRHTDNIVQFFDFVKSVGLPEIFRFETTDLYEGKNLPKVIYCIHALSHLLNQRRGTGGMKDLVGQVKFSETEVAAAHSDLNAANMRMPNFGALGKAFATAVPAPVETEENRRNRQLKAVESSIINLQSHIRGAFARRRFENLRRRAVLERREEERRLAEERRLEMERREKERRLELEREEAERRRADELEQQQRAAEIARLAAEELAAAALRSSRELEFGRSLGVAIQAQIRGVLVRQSFFGRIASLEEHEPEIIRLQGLMRGIIARREYDHLFSRIEEGEQTIISLQSRVRGMLARRRLLERIREMRSIEDVIVRFQSVVRQRQAHRDYSRMVQDLRSLSVVRAVGRIQSLARAALVRRRVESEKKELLFVGPDVVGLQAHVRGYLARKDYNAWLNHLKRSQGEVLGLQTLIRGGLVRKRHRDMMTHWRKNWNLVVRLQALARSSRQVDSYKQLTMGTNVSISTIKNFLRLLDDSEFDFREEMSIDRLRKNLIGAIKETQVVEEDVKDLDTKIALLVKNKITHEVARSLRSRAGGSGLAPNRREDLLREAKDPFASELIDAKTTRKLELYQQLFWHLQTSPEYLARWYASVSMQQNEDGGMGASEKVQKSVESITFGLFGFAQGLREEFLLLKLFKKSIEEEIFKLPRESSQSFAESDFTFLKLVSRYARGSKERKYLGAVLTSQVKQIVSNDGLDLGTDPVVIYQNMINAEELRTGRPSQKPSNVAYPAALADVTARQIFIKHLQMLRAATDGFLSALFRSTQDMPFGLRYIARELYRSLRTQYPGESDDDAIRLVGRFVYYRFIQPAIIAPESFDLVEEVVPPQARKNLSEVCKTLDRISVGRTYDETDLSYMKTFNSHIEEASGRFAQWIRRVIAVPDAEIHFRANKYLDTTSARQPVMFISPNDVYSIHSLLLENLNVIVQARDDPLRLILKELGPPPVSASAELSRARADEIELTLIPRLQSHEDPEAANKALFNLTKRRVLAILKVQHGADLEAVLALPVTVDDEDAWLHVVEEEEEIEMERMADLRHARGPSLPAVGPIDDIRSLSFHELKQETLRDMIRLRELKLVSRDDKYQAVLDAIANDIRSKHHRRIQRREEIISMKSTLVSLGDKKRYLLDQVKSYHVYIDQSMSALQKKGKRRIILPWSLQGAHIRSLEKLGRDYKYGSFKYTAAKLYERGVLLSIEEYSPRQFDRIHMVISSNEPGVFEFGLQFDGVDIVQEGTVRAQVELQDLLAAQFEGKHTTVVGSIAKANLPLLVHLINRKFYP